ncbi:phospholipid/cholesterol/gamma-HCH transport system substrate-binding protein [Nocardioides aromaticivorans]|uniref:Phospholipid/cholesterol/gamma-HCH transport system substrate-binding protein n=1 Tax=Nocardioides aromaticivorans TaxID=200618 RepID=A0A7Y9ZND0_9ACTN|nr:MCE family protein [Nocardioides aromaticivorans]NYI47125.1 phospholipid/cholesterol/gamma-HCH transport system substrate-binding protein [Nocardioides aromaticivorans]
MSNTSASHLLNRRNAATTSAAIKLGIFTAVSILVTGTLAVIMGNIGFGDRNEFKAVFTNATMLEKGDDVRVAGVNVGEVSKVEHYKRSMALVTFKVDAGVHMTTASRAEIRFLNLVGDRYMALEEGTGADGADPLHDGDTIKVENTKPALDLTVLFDGFKPLFAALTPDQVNELSMNLVQVLQGEGGTVKSLLAHTASLTTTLADRDALIGEVITNLSSTLKTVDDRHQQLSTLVVELKDWMTDLAKDRDTIGSSLDNISQLTVTVADLLRRGRPLLKEDIAALRSLSKLLNRPENRKNLSQLLDRMPETMTDQTRTGTYGSWYQYYVCGVSASIRLPIVGEQALLKRIFGYLSEFSFKSTAPRCQDH